MSHRLKRRFFPWLVAHFMEFGIWYAGAIASLVVLQLLQTQLPAEVKKLTDGKTSESPVLMFLMIAVGILIFRTLSRLLFFTPARYQQKLLRTEMLEKLEAVPPERYSKWSDGQLYQVLFNDFNNLRGFVGFALLQVGNVVIAAWVMIPRFNEADPGLWPAFIPLGVAVLFFSSLTALLQKYSKRMLDAQGQVQNHVMESYAAKATVKNYHSEDTFIERFGDLSKKELQLFFRSSVGFAVSVPLIRVGMGASLLWGAWILRERGGNASDLVFFAGYLFLILEPLMFLSWMAVVSAQGFAAWKRVKELYTQLLEAHPEEHLWASQVRAGDDRLEVNLPYWKHFLELSFPKGQMSVLCGQTGSGKSEILKKIANRLSMGTTSFSMVQQEPYLFNDTIESNIFLGRPITDDDRKEAMKFLRLFGLHVLTPDDSSLLNLEVGENGKRLSGGQAKRLALVRSLMGHVDVLLWDDPFSSVDILLERQIFGALKSDPRLSQKTFIMTSHRLTTVRNCETFYLLDQENGIMAGGSPSADNLQGYLNAFFREQMGQSPHPA